MLPPRSAGQYYGLPLLSLRAAAFHLLTRNVTGFRSERCCWIRAGRGLRRTDACSGAPTPWSPLSHAGLCRRCRAVHQAYDDQGHELPVLEGRTRDVFYDDTVHPSGFTGHRALADLLVGLAQETAVDLAWRPLAEEDEGAAQVWACPGCSDALHDRRRP